MKSPFANDPMVTLDAWDLQLCAEVGLKRYQNKLKHGVRDQLINEDVGSLQTNIVGMYAERAVTSHFGLPFDTEILIGGDDGSDVPGYSIQIKYRIGRPDGYLYFNAVGCFKAKVAILAVPHRRTKHSRTYRLAGWVQRADFASRCVPVSHGHYGKRVALEQWELNSAWDFEAERWKKCA
jgi:hypothetical protein